LVTKLIIKKGYSRRMLPLAPTRSILAAVHLALQMLQNIRLINQKIEFYKLINQKIFQSIY